ncbi:MAG: ATP-binding protein [Accumulibacter sp.]|uniref:ATP-binding protein n=1 Tax=Accumulibacter sp. TaxID=2053492 RepID=UPI003316077A
MLRSLTQVTQIRLINLRWLSVSAMAMAAVVSPNILGTHELMPRLLAFSCSVASANVCLLFATLLYQHGIPMFSLWVQLVLDLTIWAFFIYLSGGATNPLISVLLPLVAIGAMALDRFQAWALGGLAILAYSLLWRYHHPLQISDSQRATYLHLLGMWLVFSVSTIVAIWFIQQMREEIHRRDVILAEAREAALRNDWLVSLGTVAAGAAHEMATPLATLNVLADDWTDDPRFPEGYRGDLALLRKQIEVCRTTLNQLANRAHPSSSSGASTTASRIKGLVAAWHGLHPGANIELDVGDELEAQALFMDITVERAITNLLDNAEQCGATRIVVSAAVSRNWLVISIVDNGPGIADEVLIALAKGLPVLSEKGMGIGLAISKASLERCGGKMTIERRVESGTLATVILPLPEQGSEE